MLISVQDAADVLGISRQSVEKQWAMLAATGQGVMVEGRRKVEAQGLLSWWINHTRVGPVWDRLARVKKALGADPEEKLLSVGGLEKLTRLVDFLGETMPSMGIDLEAFVTGPDEATARPIPEVIAAISRDMAASERFPACCVIEPDSGTVRSPSGEELGCMWVETHALFAMA